MFQFDNSEVYNRGSVTTTKVLCSAVADLPCKHCTVGNSSGDAGNFFGGADWGPFEELEYELRCSTSTVG